MRIAFFTKYPPHQGGVSSQAAILINGLLKKNIKITVFTIAPENSKIDNYLKHKNLSVEFISESFNGLRQSGTALTERLLNKFLINHKKEKFDLIDSFYLLPFSSTAFLASKIINIPYIVRHAGSDIGKWVDDFNFSEILKLVLQNSKFVITFHSYRKKLIELGAKKEQLFFNKKESLDTNIFKPSIPIKLFKNKNNLPVVLFIGKPEENKGVFKLINAIKSLSFPVFLLLVSKKDLKLNESLSGFSSDNYQLLDFQLFYKIPNIISSADCMVCPEYDYPIIYHNPRIARESMAVGTPVIISNDIVKKWPYKDAFDKKCLLTVNPKDIKSFSKTLEDLFLNKDKQKDLSSRAMEFSKNIENFDLYIKDTINIYKKTIKNNHL